MEKTARGDSLGDRMKKYERVTDTRLITRLPVVIRLDGRAFHTLTRNLNKPQDTRFTAAMQAAAIAVCEEIDGARVAYCQSDEISVLATDYKTLETQPWFDYRTQKMCSIAASTCSVAFLDKFRELIPEFKQRVQFDCRVFNLPKEEEVANYFIWRQQDAVRNSIQGLGQRYFSHKELHQKSCDMIQEMLFSQKQINWNDCEIPQKRGYCVTKQATQKLVMLPNGKNLEVPANQWTVDNAIPSFTQDRDYIEKYLL